LKYSKKTGIRLLVILAAELLLIPETAALTKKDEPGVVSGDVYERISLEEQVEALESLGRHVPEETAASVRNSMEEYGRYDLVEESPYT
jgi:hypothetical protein